MRLILFLAAVLTAQAAAASPTAYKCTITKKDSHGWVAPEYAFQIDPEAGTAQAASNYHDWTNAQLRDRGAKGYRMIWNVTLKSTEGQAIRMRYQANSATDGGLKVSGSFVNVGASNKPYGTGRCEVVK
ncbi:hypothetical protein [Ruegeria arenilitoris]|uniref:hypothetical protein n=1 Tax=Ruegeria arenilitoris TaxID=1173585 RepID=UPI00147B7BE1|nr:hypothetical protein [Ruegeria arenilitoris]